MKTEPVVQYKGSLKGSRRIPLSSLPVEEINLSSFKASGSNSKTREVGEMLSQTFSCISERAFLYLSSSSRAVKLLRLSYWTCMVLSCISFFIFPWYSFLAFLIPALIMLLFLEALDLSKRLSDYKGPA